MSRRTFSYLASLSLAGLVALTSRTLAAQSSALPDTVRAIAALHEPIARAGATIGPRVWPGFRPDSVATLYVVPGRAKLLVQWPDTLPDGFVQLPGAARAAWADTSTIAFPRGRPIAYLSVDSGASAGSVVGLALHEQFHAFYGASAQRGRRFGAGENSMLVATYPAFDLDNEAAFALEGRILARALRARSTSDARRLAREFLAVRDARHARLDRSVVEFETAAELNEGLAQYAMLRGLSELARLERNRFAAAAEAEITRETALLDSLLAVGPRSVRRRFYATGSAMARLLDRLADTSWKAQLVREDATLQAALARAADYRGRAALGSRWTRRTEVDLAQLRSEAERSAGAVGARRRAQRDSILAGPGLRLVLDPSRLPGGRMNWCFFDPQNVLQTPAGELLHTRVLRVCSGAGVEAQLDQPVVEDRTTGIVRAAVGDADAIKLTAAGTTLPLPADGATVDVRDLRLQGPTFSVVAARATLARQGSELRVVPRPRP